MKTKEVDGYSLYTDSCGKLVVIKGCDLYLCDVKGLEGANGDYWKIERVEEKGDTCLLYSKRGRILNSPKKTEPDDAYWEIHETMRILEENREFICGDREDATTTYVNGYPVVRRGDITMIVDGNDISVIRTDDEIIEIKPHHQRIYYCTTFASGEIKLLCLGEQGGYLARAKGGIVAKKIYWILSNRIYP